MAFNIQAEEESQVENVTTPTRYQQAMLEYETQEGYEYTLEEHTEQSNENEKTDNNTIDYSALHFSE